MGFFFNEDTLKTFIENLKTNNQSSGIPALSESVNIWNTPAGLYKVLGDTTIYYRGATSTASPLTIENDTYMIITPKNSNDYKTFIIYANVGATNRTLYSGHVRSAAGALTSMNVATAYATQNYVDTAIQGAVGNALGGSY